MHKRHGPPLCHAPCLSSHSLTAWLPGSEARAYCALMVYCGLVLMWSNAVEHCWALPGTSWVPCHWECGRRQPRLGLALVSTTYMQGLADWGPSQVLCKEPSRALPERPNHCSMYCRCLGSRAGDQQRSKQSREIIAAGPAQGSSWQSSCAPLPRSPWCPRLQYLSALFSTAWLKVGDVMILACTFC